MDQLIQTFNTTTYDFMCELKSSFPELINEFEIDSPINIGNTDSVNSFMETLSKYASQISSEDETIFTDNQIILFENIDISNIFNVSSSKNKEAIWKYIQTLILIGSAIKSEETSVESMLNFFKNSMNDEDSKNMEDGIKNIFDKFEKSINDDNNGDNNIPEIKEQYESLFKNTEIGSIAEELAQSLNIESIAKDFQDEITGNGDSMNPPNIKDLLKLFSKNGKIGNIVESVSNKLEEKMKSGNINQEKIMNEAKDILGKFQDNPVMKDIFKSNDIQNLFKNCMNASNNSKNKPDLSSLFGNQNNDNDFSSLEDMFSNIQNENTQNENIQKKKTSNRRQATKERLRAKLKERQTKKQTNKQT